LVISIFQNKSISKNFSKDIKIDETVILTDKHAKNRIAFIIKI
jgi:hypothetical protein